MRLSIGILTSSLKGTASQHLRDIINSNCCDVSLVILNENKIKAKGYYKRKFYKLRSIGLLGAINGLRIRKWYSSNVNKVLRYESIDKICYEQKIPFYKVASINADESVVIINRANPDLLISLGNGYINKKVFSIPKYGTINVHHELLPEYQNAQSVIWEIYNSSLETGFTIHAVNTIIDGGSIILRKRLPIIFSKNLAETVTLTYVNLIVASSRGLIEVLKNFENYYARAQPQGIGRKYTTPSIFQFIKIYFNHMRLRRMK